MQQSFSEEIEKMLQEIDAIIQENQKLQASQIFSVRDWQAAYLLSVLILACSSLLQKKRVWCATSIIDEVIVLIFLTKLLHASSSV